jgi:hypothetical protein
MPDSYSWRREWGALILAAVVALPLFTPRLYGADEIKYITHLRSVYFDGDVDYFNDYDLLLRRDPVANAWLHNLRDAPTVTGRRLNDAPIGAALLWSPFYVVADLVVVVARAFGVDLDRSGYGALYVWGVCLGSLFWGLSGLALTYRICRRFYGVRASRFAVLGLWFASTLVFYLYITPPMAHASSLFAVALFLWLWLRTRDNRSALQWLALGAAGGLMVLVRELNWLLFIPPAVDEGWKLLSDVRRHGVGAAVQPLCGAALLTIAVGVVVAPQFMVYRALHGSFSPSPFVLDKFVPYPRHALEVLFSGFHGLYSWTPVTLMGTAGLWFFGRKHPVLASGMAAAFLVQVLVVGSYATWAGGASFGARRFINFVPIFALGLAALVDRVPPLRQRWVAVGLAALIIWNFGLALQYATGIIPRDQPVAMRTIVFNQLVHVPQRTAGVAWRFFTDRWSLVENAPGGSR